MVERSKAHVWKACEVKASEGSNPSLRAKSTRCGIYKQSLCTIVLCEPSVRTRDPVTMCHPRIDVALLLNANPSLRAIGGKYAFFFHFHKCVKILFLGILPPYMRDNHKLFFPHCSFSVKGLLLNTLR